MLAAALRGRLSKDDPRTVAGVSLKCIWIAVVLAIQIEFWQGQRQIPSSFLSPTCSQLLCEACRANLNPELLLAWPSSASGLPSYCQSSLTFGKVNGSSHPASFHQRARSCSARLQSKIDRKKVSGVSLKCICIAVVLAIQFEFWQGQRQIPSSFFPPACSQLLCKACRARLTAKRLLACLSSASGLPSYWQSRLSFGRVNGRSHPASFHQRARSCSARPSQQRRPHICCWRVSQVHLDCRRIGNPV